MSGTFFHITPSHFIDRDRLSALTSEEVLIKFYHSNRNLWFTKMAYVSFRFTKSIYKLVQVAIQLILHISLNEKY